MPDAVDQVRQLMPRTLWNLEFIYHCVQQEGDQKRWGDLPTLWSVDGLGGEPGLYEVTQLVTSFLAALVLPWEEIKRREVDSNLRKRLDEARELGWPVLEIEETPDREPRNFRDMLRLVRNAFAHGNVRLEGDPGGPTLAVSRWNQCNCGLRTWGTRIEVDQLKKFLYVFADLADGCLPRNERWCPRYAA